MQITNNIHKYRQAGRSWFQRPVSQITHLVIHHDAFPHSTKTAHTMMGQIMKVHSDRGWPGMSYHYYIHTDGKVYQTNDHRDITWHDGINNDSIGIVLTGYFHPPHNNQPTKEQQKSLYQLLDHLQNNLGDKKVVGHRDRGATACPGDTLYPLVKNYKRGGHVSDEYGNMVWKSTQHDEVTRALFGADKNPRQTPSSEVVAVVNGYKSQATDMRNKLVVAEQEIENRKEQVGRLEQRVLDEQSARKAEASALYEAQKAITKLRGEYEARLESLEKQVDQMAKVKGELKNGLVKLEAENKELRKGVKSTFTLWEWLIYPLPWLVGRLRSTQIGG